MNTPQSNLPEEPQSVRISLLKFFGLMGLCIFLAWLASVLLEMLS